MLMTAQLASAASSVALYELCVVPLGSGELIRPLGSGTACSLRLVAEQGCIRLVAVAEQGCIRMVAEQCVVSAG